MTAGPIHVVGLWSGRPVGADAEAALADAALVAGGADQLAAVADLRAPEARTAVVGAGLGALDAVADEAGPTVVLASGDPGYHGIVRALRARLGSERLVVHPAPSSVAAAFARLGRPWDHALVKSCHRGGAARAAAEVAGAPLAAVLCGPAAPPEALGAALVALGAHHREVLVASRLGEVGEELHRLDGPSALAAGTFDHRSVVVLAHPSPAPVEPGARLGGRPTAEFAHRAGMITKPEVRSVVLGRLELPERGVLWDVGAGSGSVAIEAALAAPGLRVVAIERDPAAVEAVLANAAGLGALVEVVVGSAPDALGGLPAPDRVFVGGGGIEVLDACLAAARPGARVVATYAAADRALAARTRLGELVQVSVDRAAALPDGGVRFVADNPVFVAWGDVASAQAETEGTEEGLVLGVGCSTGATAAEVDELIGEVEGTDMVRASIDVRVGHLALGEVAHGFSARLLGAVAVPNPSATVEAAVGTPSVAEAAALLAAGPEGRLVITKQRGPTATVAVARRARPAAVGTVRVVGLGPGGAAHRSAAALTAVRSADAVLGYGPYVDAVAPTLLAHQRVFRSAMGEESGRATDALALAEAGWDVALVSSGDPGIFAMAATCLEVAEGRAVPIEIVPGVTAAQAAAATLGAPLAGPHALVTLSDLLQPWAAIEGHLRAAADAGMALALYNPRSAGRPDHLARALAVLAEVLDGSTPVAVVSDATRPAEVVVTSTLATVDPTVAGMASIVLVGNAETDVIDGRLVTRRNHPR